MKSAAAATSRGVIEHLQREEYLLEIYVQEI